MNKRVFVPFALLAALLAVLIPLWAFSKDGSAEELSATDEASRDLFVTNCGSCHVLEEAGTDGTVGPNLDDRLASTGPAVGDAVDVTKTRVLSAILTGLGEGKMPAGILQGQQAEQVSDYVARVAGQ